MLYFEGVCFELTSSWPPARVEGWCRAAARGPNPRDPRDNRENSQPLIPFEAVLKKSWKWQPKMLLFVLKQQKCNIVMFKKYKVAILGGEKAPAGVCTPILDSLRTISMSWRHKNQDFVSSRHKNQDSCLQKIKMSYFEKIITWTPILYFWSIEIP